MRIRSKLFRNQAQTGAWWRSSLHFSNSGRTSGAEIQNVPARQHQIGHAEQREQLRGVLGQAAVAGLAMPEEVLHNVEGVLDLGPQAGLDLLDPLQLFTPAMLGQRPPLAGAHGHMPVDRHTEALLAFVHARVASVAEGILLVAVQQRLGLGHVGHMGRRADDRMHQPRLGIDADVRLHAELPLVALLRLVHLRIALSRRVLRRRRRSDDRRIHHRPAPQEQTLGRQMRVDRREDRVRQLLVFQQAPELQQRRGIRRRLAPQVDAHEPANRLAVVNRVLDPLVRQPQAVLHDVHAQHALQTHRRTTPSAALGIVQLDRGHQLAPRRHHLDLAEQPVPSGHTLLARVLVLRKARLHCRSSWLDTCHHCPSSRSARPPRQGRTNKSVLPKVSIGMFAMAPLRLLV